MIEKLREIMREHDSLCEENKRLRELLRRGHDITFAFCCGSGPVDADAMRRWSIEVLFVEE